MKQVHESISVREVYRMFREGQLVVPAYQRSFVWSQEHQEMFVESLLEGYPAGMVMAAATEAGRYEIVDGHQRVRTICRFIDEGFRWRQEEEPLPREEQERFLELSVAFSFLMDIDGAEQVIDLYRKVNTIGENITPQELRRAGAQGAFAALVERLTERLRQTKEEPAFSGSVWADLGLFEEAELRRREDQELIARLALSVLEGTPRPHDRELDAVYTPGTDVWQRVEGYLNAYPAERLEQELNRTFACFASLPVPLGSGKKAVEAFYLVGLAVFELMAGGTRLLFDQAGLCEVLRAMRLLIPEQPESAAQYMELKQYALWRVQDCFADEDAQQASVEREFENSMRRAKVETARYEFKQGFLRLDTERSYDKALQDQILKTLCGMANMGPMSASYLYIGVADTERDARRVELMDGIQPVEVAGHYIVGIQREVEVMGSTVEDYCKRIQQFIDHSELSRHLIVSVLSKMEVFDYRGFTVIRLVVPPQEQVSYYQGQIYLRKHSNTILLRDPREIVAVAQQFTL
ncbi:MAG: DUF262 domain-containing protein [Oscillibacter sp.]|nr:DUF262 domain-containing protein [Oscillibacter sp.]